MNTIINLNSNFDILNDSDLYKISAGGYFVAISATGTFIILVGIGATLPITSTAAVALYAAGLLGSQFASIVGWFC